MPRIKTLGWSQEFKSLDETTKAHGEDGDCVVKALTLLTGLPYAQVLEALTAAGRKPRKGTPWVVTAKALNILGFKLELVGDFIPKMIQSYPGGHKHATTITTHHPRRFKKQWADVEPLLLDCRRHVAAFKDGVVHDWTINRKMHINAVYRITRDPDAAAVAETTEPADDGLLVDGKDPLQVLIEQNEQTLADRRNVGGLRETA
jgi:hypothetical protein